MSLGQDCLVEERFPKENYGEDVFHQMWLCVLNMSNRDMDVCPFAYYVSEPEPHIVLFLNLEFLTTELPGGGLYDDAHRGAGV